MLGGGPAPQAAIGPESDAVQTRHLLLGEGSALAVAPAG